MKSLILLLLLCLPVFAQDKPNNAEAPKKSKGKITGLVLADDGQPMEGAIAYVSPTSNSNSRGWEPIVTDEEGIFVAENLSPGSYTVGANSPGFVSPENPADTKYYRPGEAVSILLVKGGVIAGRVTNALGEPVIAAPIQVVRVRDSEGRMVRETRWYAQNRNTDDKGNYRIYGLPAGKYIVSAGGKSDWEWSASASFKGTAKTYFPSSSRESATEVSVNLGEEVSGINIRYRNEKGYSISGKVFGGTNGTTNSAISVILESSSGHSSIANAYISPNDSGRTFSMHGIADGEYQISADHNQSFGQNQNDSFRSTLRKITVKSGNISGVVLTLLPLSSVEGKIELAETPEKIRPLECKPSRTSLPEEIVATLRRETIGKDLESNPDYWFSTDAPNEKGEVKFLNIEPARYRVTANLPDETWYIKSVTMKSTTPKTAAVKTAAPATINVGKQGLSLSSGEKIKDLLISVADGAAGAKGSVITDPNKILPSRMRAFLIPAEKESVEDLLRYYEVKTKNGTFNFENLAPGKYLLLTRPIPESEADEIPATPTAWDPAGRLQLRREAEAAENFLELNSCQRVNDYSLKFSQTKK